MSAQRPVALLEVRPQCAQKRTAQYRRLATALVHGLVVARPSKLWSHPQSGPEALRELAVLEELLEEQHVRGRREGAHPRDQVVDVATALEVGERGDGGAVRVPWTRA